MSPSPDEPPARLEVRGSLWVTGNGANLGGHGRMALLQAVATHGSITRAARAFGMSYKAAWEAIDTMNRAAGTALVVRSTGGRGGGSTQLTHRGQSLLQRYAQLSQVHQRFLGLMDDQAMDLDRPFSILQVLNMKTTARNEFMGTVTSIRPGAVNDEIELALPGGSHLVAIITRESTQRLALQEGLQALAIVPATHVLLAKGLEGALFSARNQWQGSVRQIITGAVNSEVHLHLDSGDQLVAIITEASVQALQLTEGARATALVKSSDVVLAVVA